MSQQPLAMTDHPNARLIREAFEVLGRGDVDGFMDYWSERAVLAVPGSIPLAGTYRGKKEIARVIQDMAAIGGENVRMELTDELLADDNFVTAFLAVTAEHDGQPYQAINPAAAQFDAQGKVTKWWWLPSDQQAWNEFWK